MRKLILSKRWIIWLILLYGFLLTATDLDRPAAFVDEAFHINIGRQLMDGTACPGCPFATGYVFLHPVLAALGDAAGGLEGARMVNVILGLCLIFFIYVTGRILFSEKVSWTTHVPDQTTNFLSSFFSSQAARLRSGAKTIGSGSWRRIASA